ncbi:MAG: hypothetical protein QOJ29_4288 [Thermoleophilaceae bacterium]|nr:hypothetical protein [Thermoleophilaceae bacterium]
MAVGKAVDTPTLRRLNDLAVGVPPGASVSDEGIDLLAPAGTHIGVALAGLDEPETGSIVVFGWSLDMRGRDRALALIAFPLAEVADLETVAVDDAFADHAAWAFCGFLDNIID